MSDFADALVGREWSVDVERVTVEGPAGDDASVIRFARELMPHNCDPDYFDAHTDGKPRRLWRWLMKRKALRVVPFAYSVHKVLEKEEENSWGGAERDYCDYVDFPSGGLVLTGRSDAHGRPPDAPYFNAPVSDGEFFNNLKTTPQTSIRAAGELPSSAYRHMGEGPVGAAADLEWAAARDRRVAAGLPKATRSWDTTKPVAALEASSAAFSAMAAACRRSSRTPVLYTLCALRALVTAKRAHVPASGLGLLCRASLLPSELFRRICLMVDGDGDVNVENIVLSRIQVQFGIEELYYDENDEEEAAYWNKQSRVVSRVTHRRIFPSVILHFHDITTRTHQLKITGRLSGFDALVPCSYRYDACEPAAKLRVINNLRKIAAYKATAMPKQVGRNVDLSPKWRHGGTSGVGWIERESV